MSSPDPIGWPFLPKPENGQLAFPTLERSVRDSIRVILSTCPGEQLMRPRFGAGLPNFLDSGNTVTLRRQIQTAILSSLQAYENRIRIDAVAVDPVPDSPTEVQVQVQYRLLRTNLTQQLSVQLALS